MARRTVMTLAEKRIAKLYTRTGTCGDRKKSHFVDFRVNHQSFRLQRIGTKEEAQWLQQQLTTAVRRLILLEKYAKYKCPTCDGTGELCDWCSSSKLDCECKYKRPTMRCYTCNGTGVDPKSKIPENKS